MPIIQTRARRTTRTATAIALMLTVIAAAIAPPSATASPGDDSGGFAPAQSTYLGYRQGSTDPQYSYRTYCLFHSKGAYGYLFSSPAGVYCFATQQSNRLYTCSGSSGTLTTTKWRTGTFNFTTNRFTPFVMDAGRWHCTVK